MKVKTAAAFRDALLGLQCLHHGGWMHRDLKPRNIGLVGTPARAILLDNGTSTHLPPDTMMRSLPGGVGTLGYLAPELEMEEGYNHSIDIWAMGIILYQLMYNTHPWKYAINPWRKENERLRSHFQERYKAVIDKVIKDYNAAQQAPTEGYIHREHFGHRTPRRTRLE